MSTTRIDVDDVDRLGRVTLSRSIEPGDLRVTGLVSTMIAVPVRFSPEMALPSMMMRAKITSWLRFLVHWA